MSTRNRADTLTAAFLNNGIGILQKRINYDYKAKAHSVYYTKCLCELYADLREESVAKHETPFQDPKCDTFAVLLRLILVSDPCRDTYHKVTSMLQQCFFLLLKFLVT